jgi:hypothetical protein
VTVKKDTSKVQLPASSTRPIPAPQATVKIGSDAPAAAPKPEIKPTTSTAAPQTTEAAPDQLTGVLAIAAALVALASLGVQLWMYL